MKSLLSRLLVGTSALSFGASIALVSPDPPTRVVFLSVGQGDCTVFQHKGATIVVDVAAKSEGFDAGERLVNPGLYRLGVRTIDILVLTHPDSDHIGGLSSVARRFSIGKVCVPESFRHHPGMLSALHSAHIETSQLLWVHRSVARLGDYTIDLLAPRLDPDEGDNEGSMIVRITNGRNTSVLSGDAGIQTELETLHDTQWHAELIKAGHHGSKGSTGEIWLSALRPRYVAISCGRNNTYGHPAPEALARIRAAHAIAVRTDESGDLEFRPSPNGFRLVRE